MKKEELESLPFEEALKRMEELVDILEGTDVPLEKAIETYEEGMALSKVCFDKLGQIQGKIEVLVEKNGEFETKEIEIKEIKE